MTTFEGEINGIAGLQTLINNNTGLLVVKMGAKRSVIYHVSLILVAITSFLFFLYLQIGFMAFFILLICIPLFSHIKKVLSVKEDFKRFDPELKKVALTTFLISIFISIIINL